MGVVVGGVDGESCSVLDAMARLAEEENELVGDRKLPVAVWSGDRGRRMGPYASIILNKS